MRFRFAGAALAAVALLSLSALPARADNYDIRDGQGNHQTMAAKLIGGILHPLHLLEMLIGGTPTAINGGQQLKANSVPVTPASDPDTRTTAATITAADVASTTVTGQNSVPVISGTPTAGSVITWLLNGHSSATVTVTGTFTDTVPIEISQDGVNFVQATSKQRGTGATTGTVTGPGIFQVDVTGMAAIRLRATAASGTLSASATASSAPGLSTLLNPVRLADASGAVSGVTGNPLYTKSNDGDLITLGALADAACGTDNGTCTTQAVLKRIAQRLTTLNATLGSPFQAGGGLGASSSIIGKVGIDHTTPGVTDGVVTTSYGAVVSTDITRPNNTTTYTQNTAWANATAAATYTTFTGVCRANGTVVLMPSIRVLDYANQTTKLQAILWLFSAPPTAINDNAAFNVAAADVANLVAQPIPFSVSTIANTAAGASGSAVASVTGTTYEIKCGGSDTNVYGMVQVTNAYIPVANEKITVALKVIGVN